MIPSPPCGQPKGDPLHSSTSGVLSVRVTHADIPIVVIFTIFHIFHGVEQQHGPVPLHGNYVVTDRAKEILPESRRHTLRHAFGVTERLFSPAPRILWSF